LFALIVLLCVEVFISACRFWREKLLQVETNWWKLQKVENQNDDAFEIDLLFDCQFTYRRTSAVEFLDDEANQQPWNKYCSPSQSFIVNEYFRIECIYSLIFEMRRHVTIKKMFFWDCKLNILKLIRVWFYKLLPGYK